jgi:hypothetical protein
VGVATFWLGGCTKLKDVPKKIIFIKKKEEATENM